MPARISGSGPNAPTNDDALRRALLLLFASPFLIALVLYTLFLLGCMGERTLTERAVPLTGACSAFPVWLARDTVAAVEQETPDGGASVMARRIDTTRFGEARSSRTSSKPAEAMWLYRGDADHSFPVYRLFGQSAQDRFSPDGRWRLNLFPPSYWLHPDANEAPAGPQVRLYRIGDAGQPLPDRWGALPRPALVVPLPEESPWQTDATSVAWQPDGRGWAMLHHEEDHRDLDRPTTGRWTLSYYRLGETTPARTVDVTPAARHPRVGYMMELLGFTRAGHPLILRWVSGIDTVECMDVAEVEARAGGVRVVRTVGAPSPKDATDAYLARCWPTGVSPRGDQVAWVLTGRQPPVGLPQPVIRWIHSAPGCLSPALRWADDRWATEIWTTRIDGTDARRVGWAAPPGPREDGGGSPEAATWSPDGHLLLFDYDRTIYALPAPRR
jgi:hypothetical protein